MPQDHGKDLSKPWVVRYLSEDGKWHKKRGRINKRKTVESRTRAAQILMKELQENPGFLPDPKQYHSDFYKIKVYHEH